MQFLFRNAKTLNTFGVDLDVLNRESNAIYEEGALNVVEFEPKFGRALPAVFSSGGD